MSKELDEKEIYQKILEKFEQKDREIAELKQKLEELNAKKEEPKENIYGKCGKCGRYLTIKESRELDRCPECGYTSFLTV